MPNTFKVLDLSISHLPAHLRTDLNANDGVIATEHATDTDWYGWWVWVPEDPDEHNDYDDFPEELTAIQRYARKHGCDWILFDRDAEVDENLPLFPTEHPHDYGDYSDVQ